jgi:hypothetical protein
MKDFKSIVFDPAKCRRELQAFGRLLQAKQHLSERTAIQGFFRKREQLSAFLGASVAEIGPAPQLGAISPLRAKCRVFAPWLEPGLREFGPR